MDGNSESYALETPNGIELTRYDPDFAAQMEIADEVVREDRIVLKQFWQFID
jgi:hypothetical protein